MKVYILSTTKTYGALNNCILGVFASFGEAEEAALNFLEIQNDWYKKDNQNIRYKAYVTKQYDGSGLIDFCDIEDPMKYGSFYIQEEEMGKYPTTYLSL